MKTLASARMRRMEGMGRGEEVTGGELLVASDGLLL
jgi:hypothetical protein